MDQAEAFYIGVLGGRLVSKNEACLEIDSGALRLYVNRGGSAVRPFTPSFDVVERAAVSAD